MDPATSIIRLEQDYPLYTVIRDDLGCYPHVQQYGMHELDRLLDDLRGTLNTVGVRSVKILLPDPGE